MSIYTAISFSPVQDFIEKSRKLRDLFGASLILSYLSYQITETIQAKDDISLISPALICVDTKDAEGMPNLIVFKGNVIRDDAANTLKKAWQHILEQCQVWIKTEVIPNQPAPVWDDEWKRWGLYSWEIFWGQGNTPRIAIRNLQKRKPRRDWVGVNWVGDSSSLSGTDSIAWPGLTTERSNPGTPSSSTEGTDIKSFYQKLAWVLDNFGQHRITPTPDDLKNTEGRYIDPKEQLSIPELVKRLVTLPHLARKIGIPELDDKFTDVSKARFERHQRTGWFMGDGDGIGDYLNTLTDDLSRTEFSRNMRTWGRQFKQTFPKALGRVVYAGGDDFLGVLYSSTPEPLREQQVIEWLMEFPSQWQTHYDLTASMGFIWAAHSVPQRDVLQYCRLAEKRSKKQGKNCVTICILFNNGQLKQWTCPWSSLPILRAYRDRDHEKSELGDCSSPQNWTHIYKDWYHLQARHAIRLPLPNAMDQSPAESYGDDIASTLFELYFPEQPPLSDHITSAQPGALVEWFDGLIHVGWYLCSNT